LQAWRKTTSPDASVFLYAFDLLELNGDDLCRDPLEVRKATLASVRKMADEPLQGHIKPSGHINKQFARWEARERGCPRRTPGR
jgi:ATP-dependent DNA ligase